MNIFEVEFCEKEIEVLKKYNLIIKNNERNYIYDESGVIQPYAIPIYYKMLDFTYTGTSWKKLIEDFTEWFLHNYKQNSNLLDLKNRNNKNIFSNTAKPGFLGPLSNGLFVVVNYGVRSWQLICDLLNHLGIEDKGYIIVHFPFHREYVNVGKVIWKKELKMFFKYLSYLGHSKKGVLTHYDILIILSRAYKKHHRRIDVFGITSDITIPYILTVDNRVDLSNVISTLRKLPEFKIQYNITIENMIDFKNELCYKDQNFSQFKTDFLSF